MDFNETINFLMEKSDSEDIWLPAPPEIFPEIMHAAEASMAESEPLIGDAVNGDYYKCCKDRFLHLTAMALTFLPTGSRLLDIGNAPGYLALMLSKAGYFVDGINLSDAWNSTYPDLSFVDTFRVQACDIEKSDLPYPSESFDAIVFTEVLEHIVNKNPKEIIPEFYRVLKKDGIIVFSTPNVCNVSNIVSLLKGNNIFWDVDIFFGGTDRHNREFTPKEVKLLFESSNFQTKAFYGMNDHANWRAGSAMHIYDFQAEFGTPDHALMRNTIIGVFQKK